MLLRENTCKKVRFGVSYIIEGKRYRLDGAIDDGLVCRCGVDTKTFDPSLTVAALRCAALLKRSSFLLLHQLCENPLFRSFGARGILFVFSLAHSCELRRIRIVQAVMGLAGLLPLPANIPQTEPFSFSGFCLIVCSRLYIIHCRSPHSIGSFI